jgi:hypothetical protein
VTYGARPKDQLELLRASGIAVSEADEKRVLPSVEAARAALNAAVKSSLFDTEPSTFDVALRKLSKVDRHG